MRIVILALCALGLTFLSGCASGCADGSCGTPSLGVTPGVSNQIDGGSGWR